MCTSGRLNIPGLIAHIESANTIWQHAWEGKKLASVGAELGWANLPQSGLMPMIAKMLADLHQIKLVDQWLRPCPSPETVSEHAHVDVANILQMLPEKQEMLEEIVAKFDASAPSQEKMIPPTTIHGTFKIAQILCRDTPTSRPAERHYPESNPPDDAGQHAGAVKLALVDFDSIASGDPLLDVAEFVASLAYLQVSDDIPAAPVQESIKSFLTSYQEQVSWTCDRERLGWYVAAFLCGKIHASLKSFEVKATANIFAAFHLITDWLNVLEILG